MGIWVSCPHRGLGAGGQGGKLCGIQTRARSFLSGCCFVAETAFLFPPSPNMQSRAPGGLQYAAPCLYHLPFKISHPAKSRFPGGLGVCQRFCRIGNLAVTSEVLALARQGLCAKIGSVPMEIITSCNIRTIISLSKHKECENRRNAATGLPRGSATLRFCSWLRAPWDTLGGVVPAIVLEVSPD